VFNLDGAALNADQVAAINEPNSVFLVACPGSGKTRTLTFKVASELSKIDSHRRFVAAITYTHRAADEIEERIADLGVDTDQLWIGTIHSFCLEWILRPYGIYHDRLARGFSVIDIHDREMLLTRLCEPFKMQKVSFYDCEFFFTEAGPVLGCQDSTKHASLKIVLTNYFDELERTRQIDFELILYLALQIIQSKPSISKVLSKLFSFIAVDEYQDTKKIQYLIIASILKAGNGTTRTLIVGDPNQAIFGSLGGFAISASDFRAMIGIPLVELELTENYRSSARVIDFFGNFMVHHATIQSASDERDYPSLITFNDSVSREGLEGELVRLIRHNVEVLGIEPGQICVIAPWWHHLAGMTRKLVVNLPEYEFDGPGMVPFGHLLDNIWYKMSKIALTEASPRMFVTRLRWAQEIIDELAQAGVDTVQLTKRSFLRASNSVESNERNGLSYLIDYFDKLFTQLRIEFSSFPALKVQYDAFFASSSARVERLKREGAEFIGDVDSFRRVFRKRTGITVSTIHGVKGAEFDTVIAYALLEGMVPHFSERDKTNSAKKLLYVIGSRARKNVHLISERGRTKFSNGQYDTTDALRALTYDYNASLDAIQ
jgi:DNA helicase-2/ATP-dependent DNA helicase PcrA